MNRTGVVLPIALLLLLGLGVAAASTLVVARTELLLERGNTRYLEERIAAESRLGPSIDGTEGRAGAIPLLGGFLLISSAAEGPRSHAVRFYFHPDSVAAGFPGALEVGGPPPSGGVSRGEGECAGAGLSWQPLVRVRVPTPPADPEVPDPPLLGPLGLPDLLEGAVSVGEDSGRGSALPALSGASILHAPPGSSFVRGAASGILLGSGDLTLTGDATFRGLVMVAGDLEISEGAAIEGVVLVGGVATLSGTGRIVGCRAAAVDAVRRTLAAGEHAVPGGALLGRF